MAEPCAVPALVSRAVEHVGRLADRIEWSETVGGFSRTLLKERAASVQRVSSCNELVLAVGDVFRDCASLPEWVEHDYEAEERVDGEFSWPFGVESAEALACATCAVAEAVQWCTQRQPNGASCENGCTGSSFGPGDLVEELGRELDCLAPYLFGGLCRSESSLWSMSVSQMGAHQRLANALQSVCIWTLAAIGRLAGYERLGAQCLWEWTAGDGLYVMVLIKGALQKGAPAATQDNGLPFILGSPPDLPEIRAAVLGAVFDLTSTDVAFSAQLRAAQVVGKEEDEDVSIGVRASQLTQHRANLASNVAESQLLGTLATAAMEAPTPAQQSSCCSKLASWLVALLQPELKESVPPWAAGSFSAYGCVELARGSAGELRSSLGWFADDVWTALAAAPAATYAAGQAKLPAAFLRDCASIAFAAPDASSAAPRLIEGCLAVQVGCSEPRSLAALSILAANAGLEPHSTGQCLAGPLLSMPTSTRFAVCDHISRWKGPTRSSLVSDWLSFIRNSSAESLLAKRGPREVVQCEDDEEAEVEEESHNAAAALLADVWARGISSDTALNGLSAPFEPAPPSPPPPPAPEEPERHGQGQQSSNRAGSGLRELLREAPEHLRCQLDGRLLTDPVRSPHGHVFERSVLATELKRTGVPSRRGAPEAGGPVDTAPSSCGAAARRPLEARRIAWGF
eukprot:TRINITY_DN38057_c0_g1_i2.p1 TRINITY_DN38057_c0_g1~~TRINITY_DN38057_c0_g1_i2.p1  ORF type:complete len:685 (-),score=131.37 TRINITY_DN38057_c0_g1_i2:105-2159(-)